MTQIFPKLLQDCFPEIPVATRQAMILAWPPEKLISLQETGHLILQDSCLGVGSPLEAGIGTLLWVLVPPEKQGIGRGKTLVMNLLSHYAQNGAHKVKVTTPTCQGRDFYKALGFAEEGFHPSHWWGLDFWSLGIKL